MAGKTLQVVLYLDAKGAVTSLQIKNPAEAGGEAFREQLSGMIFQWKFPDVKRAGSVTVTLETPKQVTRPPRPPDWGMCEMAPMPNR